MAVGQMSRVSDQSKAESARARLCHKQPVDDGPLARQVGTVHAQQPGRGPSMVPQHDSTGVHWNLTGQEFRWVGLGG
jgi:hypothetical protein